MWPIDHTTPTIGAICGASADPGCVVGFPLHLTTLSARDQDGTLPHPAIQVAGKTTILWNASAAGGSTGRHFEDLPDPSLAFLNSSLRCAHSACENAV